MNRQAFVVLCCLPTFCAAVSGEDKPRILRGHEDAVQHVTFSPDANRVGSVGLDNKALLWDAETGNLIHRCSGRWQIAFLDRGKSFVTCDGSRLQIWDSVSGRLIREERRPIRSLGAGHKCDWFACAESYETGIVGFVSDSERVKSHFRLPSLHNGRLADVSRDGKWIAFTARGQFGLLNVDDSSLRHVSSTSSGILPAGVFSAEFSADASQLLICQRDQISLYDCSRLKTDVLIKHVGSRWQDRPYSSDIQMFRDATFVASKGLVAIAVNFTKPDATNGFRIDLMEIVTKTVRRSISADRLPTSVACAVDGSALAAGFPDGTVRVWDLDLENDE